jgi:hypothetical protein
MDEGISWSIAVLVFILLLLWYCCRDAIEAFTNILYDSVDAPWYSYNYYPFRIYPRYNKYYGLPRDWRFYDWYYNHPKPYIWTRKH